MDKALRNTLRNVVTQCRKELEKAVAEMLEGQFGIYASGKIDDATAMSHLSAEDQEYRSQLLVHLEHIQVGGFKAKDAAEQLIREVAFTHLNRFCAYKMMEVRKLIRESVSRGYASNNVKFYLAEHPEDERLYNAGQQATAYQHFLEWLGGTLSEEIGVLFSPHDPANRLLPPQRVLDQVLELLNSEALKDIWAEDETIGWIYQYFTPKELRDQARKESQAPRNSYELAFRNQFYTPSYVVQFLTDNTLGRIWYEMRQGETALKALCHYMVCRPNEVFLVEGEEPPEEIQADESLSQEELLQQPVYIPYRKLKDPREIRVLDPACGSGHFLLYCFTLLLAIYEEAWDVCSEVLCDLRGAGVSKEAFMQQVPGLILAHNLHGIDIDIRATQIAALALWLRAQRAYQEMGLKKNRPKITKSNIVCAEPMPGEKTLLEEFIAELQPKVLGQLVRVLFNKMRLAGEVGSLLKIEEEIWDVITEAKKQWKAQPEAEQLTLLEDFQFSKPNQLSLFDVADITDEIFWHEAETKVIEALQQYAEQTTSKSVLQRQLFSEDAVQGFSFISVCRKQFDVVLMNPPFGKTSIAGQDYFDAVYSEFKSDIGIAFVDRWCSLLSFGGFLGAITSRTFLASDSLDKWRANKLLSEKPLQNLLDLGYGVLDEAMVETSAYVLSSQKNTNVKTYFIRALEVQNKELEVRNLFQNNLQSSNLLTFSHKLEVFKSVPLYVICYWLPDTLLRKIISRDILTKTGGAARHGLVTTDDFRFIRSTWEVAIQSLGYPNRWVFLAKGGEYQPYWDDIHLVLDWENDGGKLKDFLAAKRLATQGSADWSPWLNHHEYYFQHGLTYPERTTSDFCPRIMPENIVFSSSGQAIQFENNLQVFAYAGGAFSRLFRLIVESFVGSGDNSVSGSAAKHYRSGLLNILPPPLSKLSNTGLESVTNSINFFRYQSCSDETTRLFSLDRTDKKSFREKAINRTTNHLSNIVEVLKWHLQIEDEVHQEFKVSSEDYAVIEQIVGQHPLEYESTKDVDQSFLLNLWNLSIESLVEIGINSIGARRQITKKSYIVDRRLELISHILSTHPDKIVNLLKIKDVIQPGTLERLSQDALSEAVGYLFGRWDIRFTTGQHSKPELPDPFAPLPVYSPGMLTPDSSLTDYPIELDQDGILVDDPDHPDDIIRRIRNVLEVIWSDNADAIEQEACEILGVKDLRDYFRKPGNGGFWQDHIKRYSKSRRKAPIYWLLQSSKKSYALWLYYHRLDKDILFKAHTQYVEPKLNLETDKLNQLNNQRATLSGTALKKLERDIEKQENLVSELTDFSDKLQRAAKLDFGRNLNQDVVFDPDLNDGVVLNIAPLWELTPWSEAKKYWQELTQGKYEWSSIGKQLRAKGIVQC